MRTAFRGFAIILSTQLLATMPSAAEPVVAVAPQYGTTHVYVAPEDVDRLASSFLATFGGQSTKQVVATVTPTPSSTTSQLLQTPVGAVSFFGFTTPVPYPFGAERSGYLVTDMDAALKAARAAGADVLVAPFPDPIGTDAVIQWPGGVNMQLHAVKPSYEPFHTVPESDIRFDGPSRCLRSRLRALLSRRVVADDPSAPGVEIGRPSDVFRRVRIESDFGKVTINVTDGHLPIRTGVK